MLPTEGRRRVVIEEVQPTVNAGRYAAKRVIGDTVTVTAAVFSDGHDHVRARLLYRTAGEKSWRTVECTALPNDMWSANFIADKLGTWEFTLEAWVDHFDTWVHELEKRLAAQGAAWQGTTPEDIELALLIGANHLDAAAQRAASVSIPDATALRDAARELRSVSYTKQARYENPLDDELVALAYRYPDLTYATRHETVYPLWVDRERARFSAWYELFPRSTGKPGEHGTLRDTAARLPEIAAMGFDTVYMPPIHPIGVKFRKGKNNSVTCEPGDVGSPWAIGAKEGGHDAILPELGTLKDFDALVAEAARLGMEIALDIAFQCAPDHPWVKAHPEWFIQRPDGTIQYAENPPKKYQDIYPLNFESTDWQGLWEALCGVFQFWIARGVRTFRVDNPHTKALPFWEWCITEIHATHPDVIFLAEAFTRPHVMYSLAKGGYTQGYTYFTWRQAKWELEQYFTEICNAPVADFFRPNVWPNTPDILHAQLQEPDMTRRRAVFLQRLILATTLSANYGIYGPAYELCEWRPARPTPGKSGSEEYLDSEKYQLRQWDRSSSESIAPVVRLLNHLRRENAALQRNENLTFHPTDNEQLMCYSKATAEGTNTLIMVVNLDTANVQRGIIDLAMDKLGLQWDETFIVEDLLSGARYTWSGQRNYVELHPHTMPAHIFRVVR